MERRRPPSDPRGFTLPVRAVIWISFLFAVFAYGLVGFLLADPRETGLSGWLLPGVAVAFGGVALLIPRWMPSPVESRGDRASTGAAEVISWAFDESVAVVGLLSVFLGGTWSGTLPYLLASLVLLWLHRPRS